MSQNVTSMSCPKFNIQEMFNVVNGRSQTFGIPNYTCVKDYFDYNKVVLDREYLKQEKGQKPKIKPTQRGSFLDPILKINRKIYPAPVHYETIINWPDCKPKNAKKLHYPKRLTYVDEIKNQKFKTPGVGNYKLLPNEQDIQLKQEQLNTKKIKHGEKFGLFSDTEFIANSCPGAGNYNPHEIQKKIKNPISTDNPKGQIQKDKELEAKRKVQKFPDMGTYTPIESNYKTFDSLKLESSNKKSVRYLGTEERFKQPSNKVFRLNVPGPGNYDVKILWQGKSSSIPATQRNSQPKDWFDKISKGQMSTRSIYY